MLAQVRLSQAIVSTPVSSALPGSVSGSFCIGAVRVVHVEPLAFENHAQELV